MTKEELKQKQDEIYQEFEEGKFDEEANFDED